MNELIAITFDDETRAAEALAVIARLRKEHIVELSDAAVVTKNKAGEVKLHQTIDFSPSKLAATGGLLGLLIGLIFFIPVVGTLGGLALGALVGKVTDLGIDDQWMKQVGQSMKPGSSAVFLLIRNATPDKFLEAIGQFEGTIFKTSLPAETEAVLRAAVERSGNS
jgi:uncharacterized membrane protein